MQFDSMRAKGVLFAGISLLLVATGVFFRQQQLPQVLLDAPMTSPALQCVSYAPFYKSGMNPTLPSMQIEAAQIEADLKAISKLTHCVRTYAVAQGLDAVPQAAQKLGMKVILGAWISWTEADNRAQLEKAVALANQYPDTVRGLIIGNEVLLRGEQTEATLRGYLQWAQAHTDIPITYADVWEFWLKHPALEQEVDFITVHILPYWEDLPVAIEQAVSHTTAVMDKLSFTFKKTLLIGETGWPSQGRQRFGAKPSLVNEARYMREFLLVAQQRGWQYNMIEAVDQPWKRELEGTVGGYWGLFDTDLTPKFAMQGGVAERADGVWPYVIAGLLAVVAAVWVSRVGGSFLQCVFALLTAATLGLHAYLQVDYVHLSARNSLEFALLGSVVLLGWLLVVLQVRQWMGRQMGMCWENRLLLLFALSLLMTSASLAIDGRYRNFPLVLYWLPLLVIGLSVLASADQTTPAKQGLGLWLLAVFALLATNLAIAVAMMESGNTTAWWWVGLCGLAVVVLPSKAWLSAQARL